MKKFTPIIFAFLISLPSLAQKVTVDFDKTADFSKYKSFQFLGWQEDIDQVINTLDQDRFRKAFKSEFDKRNIPQMEEGADITVAIYMVIDQKSSTTAYTNYYGGAGMGYRYGGWGWGNGYSTTTYSENDYLAGTLVLDVYDNGTLNLIWQGVATGTVKEKPEKREKNIPKTVAKLMKKFPVSIEVEE